jgi:NADPH-dependent glutamate synthase beta subunit-like oxidoreductase
MRYGIPAYRLSREVLDSEIDRILAMGIAVHCNHRIKDANALKSLIEQHDALYLAMGAECNKRLPTLDYSQPWVCDGAAYLAAANAGVPMALGHRLVVIGGGSAALDAARSARRLGHDVVLLALEQRFQMPAQEDEVVEALEEGIALVDGARLDSVLDGGAKGLTLTCTRVAFVPGAERGQFSLTVIEGSRFTLDADAVITSIGQDPNLSVLGADFAVAGGLLKTDARMATSSASIYAGGDLTNMARFVTEAIGMGQRAALAIANELQQLEAGANLSLTPHADDEPLVPLAAISTYYHPRQERVRTGLLEPQERLKREAEVQLGIDTEQASAESDRCFSCGTCINCDNCVVYCPDMAIKRVGDDYIVLTDYCKGCGACVKECPTGSMKMQEELR